MSPILKAVPVGIVAEPIGLSYFFASWATRTTADLGGPVPGYGTGPDTATPEINEILWSPEAPPTHGVAYTPTFTLAFSLPRAGRARVGSVELDVGPRLDTVLVNGVDIVGGVLPGSGAFLFSIPDGTLVVGASSLVSQAHNNAAAFDQNVGWQARVQIGDEYVPLATSAAVPSSDLLLPADAWTAISYDSASESGAGVIAGSFTAAHAGLYAIKARTFPFSSDANFSCATVIRHNGTIVAGYREAGNTVTSVAFPLTLAVSDVVDVRCYPHRTSGSAAVNNLAGSSYLHVYRV